MEFERGQFVNVINNLCRERSQTSTTSEGVKSITLKRDSLYREMMRSKSLIYVRVLKNNYRWKTLYAVEVTYLALEQFR